MDGRLEDRISGYLTEQLNLDGTTKEILNYSLHLLFSTIVGMVFIIIVSVFLGVLPYTLWAVLSAAVVRTFSGGAHCTSPLRCSLMGAIVFPVLGLLAKTTIPLLTGRSFLVVSFLMIIFSMVSYYRWSPADSPGKPISTLMEKKRLRRLTFMAATLVASLSLVLWYLPLGRFYHEGAFSLLLGLTWQGYSISPLGYRFTHWLDGVLTFHT